MAALRKIPNYEKSRTPPFAEIPDPDPIFALTQNLNSSLPESNIALILSFLILLYLSKSDMPTAARLLIN